MPAHPSVTLRLMTEQDLPLLHTWANTPHWREWWGDELQTIEAVREHYMPRVLLASKVTPYIVMLGSKRIGYAQSYVVMGHGGGWWEDETDPGARGIDQSIGPVHLLNQGLGTLLVKTLVAQLFADPAVTKIQTDPSPKNLRAIRCYEKAGFRRVKEVMTPDGPAVFMLKERA